MTKKDGLFNRLQGWLQKQLSLNRHSSSQSSKTEIQPLTETQVPQPQADENYHKPRSTANTKPFILGTDNIKDVGGLTNNNFQKLVYWNWFGRNKIDLPERESLSTEELLGSISWDFEPNHQVEPVLIPINSATTIPVANSFILGLDEIPNLDTIVSRDFLNFINWEVNPQLILAVEVEDYSLLDDLLETFPD